MVPATTITPIATATHFSKPVSKAEKPLFNVTPFEYLYVPATYFLGLDNEEWITTYKTTNKWILENVRRYDNQLQLTGEHYQYREITLER